MKNRNIVVCIILSLITCGIYGLYWFIVMTNDMNTLTPNDTYQTDGVKALIFTLLSCGIYGWYWSYKMGLKMDQVKVGGSHAVLFILLQIFGLGIVNYCIMQSAINEKAY